MARTKNYDADIVTGKAMMVFWKNGYRATSMRMLEKEMGINQFSIYSSFKSKLNLFIECLRKYKQQVRAGLLKILIESDGSLNDIREFMNRFVQSVKSGNSPSGCLIANTAAEFGNSNKQVKDELNDYYLMLEDLFSALLTRAASKKEISSSVDIRRSAKFLVTSTQGMAVTAKILSSDDMSAFIETVISSFE